MATGSHTHVTLSTGAKMPSVGLGTWQSTPDEVKQAVKEAIKCGYRLIDTAWAYRNEKEIGEALQELFKNGTIKREDLFITTKLHGQYHRSEDVAWAIRDSLKSLQLDYVDLFLIHSPMAVVKSEETLFPIKDGKLLGEHIDHMETWRAMEKLYKEGLAKAIGLSNFNCKQIENILKNAEIKPHNLQVECNCNWPQNELHALCTKNNITFTAYAPIGSPGHAKFSFEKFGKKGGNTEKAENTVNFKSLMENETVRAVADKHKKTPAQVLIRWLIQRGMSAIPKSVNPARIAQNFDVWNFELSSDEMEQLSGLQTVSMFKLEMAMDHPDYPWKE